MKSWSVPLKPRTNLHDPTRSELARQLAAARFGLPGAEIYTDERLAEFAEAEAELEGCFRKRDTR